METVRIGRVPLSRRLRADLEAGGPGHLIRHIGRKLASPLVEWGRLAFYARDLDGDLPLPPAPRGLQLRQASVADVGRLLYPERPVTADGLAERFRRGHLCFVALDAAGAAAHARWVSTDRAYIPELDADAVMAPGEAYMYDGYTRPDARGAGIDGAIRSLIFLRMHEGGFRRVYSYVRADNPIGTRAARRWQRFTGAVRYVRFRGGRPRMLSGSGEHPRLVPGGREERKRAERARALHEWFSSWLSAPLERRSTGYDALPEPYFASTAQYVVDTLGLDPEVDNVLDVGCDSAMVSGRVALKCRTLVGVDYIPELLLDAGRRRALAPASGNAVFAAADGRQLPFAAGAFGKVYCMGVIHCLPTQEDGLAMIRDLVRVCAPGGTVLVGAIPDHAKRWVRRRDFWKENGWAQRLRLLASLAVPVSLKPTLSRLGIGRTRGPSFLDYDLEEIRRLIVSDTLRAEVRAFPKAYWNRDFRRTRSNLVLNKLGVSRSRTARLQGITPGAY